MINLTKIFPESRTLLAGLVVALALPAYAVEDCFDDYCSSSGQSVLGFLGNSIVYPGDLSTNPTYFGTTGMIDYDTVPGPEVFAVAGESYFFDGVSPGTQIDTVQLKVNIYDSPALSNLSTIVTSVNTDEYVPLAPGLAKHAFVFGGGIVNGSAGSRMVGTLVATVVTDDPSQRIGFVKVQVYDTNGARVWRKKIPGTDGLLALLGTRVSTSSFVGSDNAVMFGDFLNDDGVDELRVIYQRTESGGKQVYKYEYYSVDDGSFIRSDKIQMIPPV